MYSKWTKWNSRQQYVSQRRTILCGNFPIQCIYTDAAKKDYLLSVGVGRAGGEFRLPSDFGGWRLSITVYIIIGHYFE